MAEAIVVVSSFFLSVIFVGWVLRASGLIFPSAGDLTGMTVLDAANRLIASGYTNIWIVQKDQYLGDQTIKLNVKDFHDPSKIACYYWMSWWTVHEYEPTKREHLTLFDRYCYHLCPFTKHSKVVLIAYFDELKG